MATREQITRVTPEAVLEKFYRYPKDFVSLPPVDSSLSAPGFFRFGKRAVGYGATNASCPEHADADLPDLLAAMGEGGPLPFDPEDVIQRLQRERYPYVAPSLLSSEWARQAYYHVRPFLSAGIRNALQRRYFRGWEQLRFPAWPVDTSVEVLRRELLCIAARRSGSGKVPIIWFWPEGAPAAAIMTHDVETSLGLDFVPALLGIDEEFGISAAYQLVPEQRYHVPPGLLDRIRAHGSEVNVHDLTHSGNLFRDREEFRGHARGINKYLREWGSEGFRAGCMYRNAEWFSDLDASYDMSVPNVAHLEPQRGGCCTVFPYFIGDLLELPLTMTQDFSLFHMLRNFTMDLWEQQMAIIMEQHGLMSFIVHPDYILEARSQKVYRSLLQRLAELRDEAGVWVARPKEVAQWWRDRNASTVVQSGGRYIIQGPARDRARIAYADFQGDQVRYEITESAR